MGPSGCWVDASGWWRAPWCCHWAAAEQDPPSVCPSTDLPKIFSQVMSLSAQWTFRTRATVYSELRRETPTNFWQGSFLHVCGVWKNGNAHAPNNIRGLMRCTLWLWQKQNWTGLRPEFPQNALFTKPCRKSMATPDLKLSKQSWASHGYRYLWTRQVHRWNPLQTALSVQQGNPLWTAESWTAPAQSPSLFWLSPFYWLRRQTVLFCRISANQPKQRDETQACHVKICLKTWQNFRRPICEENCADLIRNFSPHHLPQPEQNFHCPDEDKYRWVDSTISWAPSRISLDCEPSGFCTWVHTVVAGWSLT